MIIDFHPTLGQTIEGLLLLVSVGFNGLLIQFVKLGHEREEDQLKNNKLAAKCLEEYEFKIEDKSKEIEALNEVNAHLVMNQKPIPWNKGKSGYKLKRKTKDFVYSKPETLKHTFADGEVVTANLDPVHGVYKVVSRTPSEKTL